VDNIYLNGASADSFDLNPSGFGVVDVYFGSIIDGEYKYKYRLHDSNNTSKTLVREYFNPMKTLPLGILTCRSSLQKCFSTIKATIKFRHFRSF